MRSEGREKISEVRSVGARAAHLELATFVLSLKRPELVGL